MSQAALVFKEEHILGRVAGVDTHRISIAIANPNVVTRIGVGNLIAISGATEQDFLIAIVERVLRSLSQTLPDLTEDDDDLSLAVSPVDTVRATLIGTYRTVDGSKSNTFKRGADTFPQIDRLAYVIEARNLQNFMGLLGSGFDEEEKLKLGRFVADTSAEAIASGDKLFQRHAAILGSTGSGKSYAVALLLERAAKLKHPNIVVLDMHGEYAPLTEGSDAIAVGFKIAGPGNLDTPSENCIFMPYWMLNNEEMLSMILDRSDQNAPNQASRFRLHLRNLKRKTLEEEGQAEVEQTFTIDSPVPYRINDLLNGLRDDDMRKGVGAKGAAVKGEWEGKLTRFISRLEAKLEDRRYGFMFMPPNHASRYEWLAEQAWRLLQAEQKTGIKIIDFSEVPPDVLPVVAGMLARFVYDTQFWMAAAQRSPLTILCDEAHLYLPVRQDADAVERQALATFERIAKEGRKYGVSMVVVSQRPADISRTILSQCNNFISLRLTNDTDQSVIRRLVPDQMSGLTDILPLLDVGEALVLGDAVLLPTRIKLDKPQIEPLSATRDFWREWAEKATSQNAVRNAVQSLRGQTRLC
jgi:hypothetical protein